jgi:uncharacterized protein YukE
MAVIGADPESLHTLASSLHAASAQLDRLTGDLGRRTRAAGWRGIDADRFEREWATRHRPAMVASVSALAMLARRLGEQAEQQRKASGPDGTAPVPSTVAGSSRPGATPVGPRDLFLGGFDISVGPFTASLTADVSLEALPGDRTLVTVATGGSLGPAAALGAAAWISAGDHARPTVVAVGTGAEAAATLGGIERNSWSLPNDQVPGLLARLAASEAIDQLRPGATATAGGHVIGGGGAAALLSALGAMADNAVGRLTGIDIDIEDRLVALASIPPPSRSEHLVHLGVSAGSIAAPTAGPTAQLRGDISIRAGTAVTPTTTSTVIECSGTLSASIAKRLLGRLGAEPAPHGSTAALRVELVRHRSGGPEELIVTTTSILGSDQGEHRLRLRLPEGDPAATAGIHSSVRRLAAGDVSGAVRDLSSLRPLPTTLDSVEVSTAVSTVRGSGVRAGATANLGIGAGFSGRGQHLRIEPGS